MDASNSVLQPSKSLGSSKVDNGTCESGTNEEHIPRIEVKILVLCYILIVIDGYPAVEQGVVINPVFLPTECTRILCLKSYFASQGRNFIFNEEYEKSFAVDIIIGGMMNVTIGDVTIDVHDRRSAASSYSDMVFKDGSQCGWKSRGSLSLGRMAGGL